MILKVSKLKDFLPPLNKTREKKNDLIVQGEAL